MLINKVSNLTGRKCQKDWGIYHSRGRHCDNLCVKNPNERSQGSTKNHTEFGKVILIIQKLLQNYYSIESSGGFSECSINDS